MSKYPYLVMQNRELTIQIGFLELDGKPVPGARTEITTPAGMRQFRLKRDADAFVEAMAKDYGADVVGPVIRA